MHAAVAKIHRYPVKGLSAQELASVDLTAGEGLPHDRRFALLHPAHVFDIEEPAWRAKTHFLMLARDERLAALDTDFDEATTTLVIRRAGRPVARGQIGTPMGRLLIEQFFAAYMAGETPGPPKLVEAPGHMFSDTRERLVSIINAASVRDLERVVKRPVDPLRLRGNLLVEGLEPWSEFALVGQAVTVGEARLEVVEPIERCAAINVDPRTGARDMNLPQAMQHAYGHIRCGVYARVVTGGRVALGDPFQVVPPS